MHAIHRFHPVGIATLLLLLLCVPMARADIAFYDIGAELTRMCTGGMSWADYDGDGDLDLLLHGYGELGGRYAKLYDNDGSGVFTENLSADLEGVSDGAADWGDYDNDGDLDLLLMGYTTSGAIHRIYENLGDGSFAWTSVIAGPTGLYLGDLAWGDYDGDGDLDFVTTGRTGTQGYTRIYQNLGGGVFEPDLDAGGISFLEYSALAWGDYDDDGDLDLALAGYTGSTPITRIYANDGTGFFTVNGLASLPGVYFGDVAWGDCDNDGDLDLAITGRGASENLTRVYMNDGGGSFSLGASLQGVDLSSLDWGDYDNDGDLDLVCLGEPSASPRTTRIYVNDGTGNFGLDGAAGLPGLNQGGVAWGDYDGDGDLDLALTGLDGTTYESYVYANQSTVPNTPPVAPSGLVASRSGTTMSFSWGPGSDAETAALALSYNLRVGTTRHGSEIVAPMALLGTGYRQVVGMGNRGTSTSWQMEGLQRAWYWSVQTIDQGHMGSAFAPVDSILYMPLILSVEDVPEDQGGWLRLRTRASELDDASVADYPIASYNVWRRLDDLPLAKRVLSEGRETQAKASLPAGTLEYDGRLFAASATAEVGVAQMPPGVWEIVGSFAATQAEDYWTVSPTLADLGEGDPPWSVYVLSAHTTTPSIWFASDPDSSYSTDDIAPSVPTGLDVTYWLPPGNSLSWDPCPDEDFQYFRIYWASWPDFTPGEGFFAAATTETSWVDTIHDRAEVHYKVTAVDHAGNESAWAASDPVTGLPTSSSRFALHGNVPNPFNPSTTVFFELPPGGAEVTLKVFGLDGRLVRVLEDGFVAEGRQSATWDGRDLDGRSVASGVYFCRMEATGFLQTRKMTLLK